jgi:hypothetical protein
MEKQAALRRNRISRRGYHPKEKLRSENQHEDDERENDRAALIPGAARTEAFEVLTAMLFAGESSAAWTGADGFTIANVAFHGINASLAL